MLNIVFPGISLGDNVIAAASYEVLGEESADTSVAATTAERVCALTICIARACAEKMASG